MISAEGEQAEDSPAWRNGRFGDDSSYTMRKNPLESKNDEMDSPPLRKLVVETTLSPFQSGSFDAEGYCSSDGALSTKERSTSLDEAESSTANNSVVSSTGDGMIPSTRFKSNRSSPTVLYAREEEQKALERALERCTRPPPPRGQTERGELVLVTGYSGNGKTSLVRYFFQNRIGQDASSLSFEASSCYLISGKFDQMERQEQYYPIVQALTEFVDQISNSDAEMTSFVRNEIKMALRNIGDSEHLLVELVPALDALFDDHYRLFCRGSDSLHDSCSGISGESTTTMRAMTGASASTSKRINYLLHRFFSCVCSPSRPIVLFLDDLQWADPTFCDLIASLVSDRIPGLLVIGACRGNEVSIEDHLSVTLRELEASEVTISEVYVGSLKVECICTMMSDVLVSPVERCKALAEVIHSYTDGNIFFVIQLLQWLVEEGLLYRAEDDELWLWDERQLSARVLGEDGNDGAHHAADLIAGKIKRLDKSIQDVLMIASCLGAEFDEYLLHEIITFDVGAPLSIAEEKGLIVREKESVGTWRFLHDQIQQGAYSLIPPDEREQVHLQIGRKLWDQLPPDQLSLHTFLVVNQLRLGVRLITDCSEKERFVVLLLRAGEKAAFAAAFSSASEYLKLGISLLDNMWHWRDQYELSLQLYSAAAEAEYCNGNIDRMDALIWEILRHAKTNLDKSRALTSKMLSLGSRNELQKAIDLGLTVLKDLGEPFPKKPSVFSIIFELSKTKRMLRKLSKDGITKLPPMEDPTKLAAMKIMSLIFVYCLNGRPMHCPLVAMRIVQNSILHGASAMSAVGFSAFGLLLCIAFGDEETGYQLGREALNLLDRFQGQEWLPRVYSAVFGFCFPCKEPLIDQLKPLLASHHVGLGVGDIELSMLSASLYIGASIAASVPLAPLSEEMEGFHRLMLDYKQQNINQFLRPNRQLVQNLLGESDDPAVLDGDAFNEHDAMKEAVDTNNQTIIAFIHLNKLILASYFQRYDLASVAAYELSKTKLDGFTCFSRANVWLYEGLTCVALSHERRRKRMKVAKRDLKRLKRMSTLSPENVLNKVYLLEAEIEHANGKFHQALEKYSDSYRQAIEVKLFNEAGLCCECAAAALQTKGRYAEAAAYLDKAVVSYRTWGAVAKVTDVQRKLDKVNKRVQPETAEDM